MATIGLDGHFRQLNQAFTDLVGYPESEFAAATWPPVMDRANLTKHREQMDQMLSGEIDSADVNTGYVHAQGLLVPVAGEHQARQGGRRAGSLPARGDRLSGQSTAWTRTLNSARKLPPGGTKLRPSPLTSAFTGAVIGSKQT